MFLGHLGLPPELPTPRPARLFLRPQAAWGINGASPAGHWPNSASTAGRPRGGGRTDLPRKIAVGCPASQLLEPVRGRLFPRGWHILAV